jgi:selenocysteine lyase/cysteine desulfurase
LSFKPLFSRSLGADPGRLHFAAHSHHLWPDASLEGQIEAWNDAARLADRKWDLVMNEVWPEAQASIARELGTDDPSAIAFASNTHDFLVRLIAAAPRGDAPLKVLTTDGEFHSARRQFARLETEGWILVQRLPTEPFSDLSVRLLSAARDDPPDLIFISHVFFGSGRVLDSVGEIASLARAGGPWVIIDGYHAFMALQSPLGAAAGESAFYLGGGYKYAMAGEGCAFLHAPPGFGERPPITGWFAEFEDLSLPAGGVGYASDARRFLGATFDPSGLYRFNAVQRMLSDNGLTTASINAHVSKLQVEFVHGLPDAARSEWELLNPLESEEHARFLAFRTPNAQRWHERLEAKNCITDVRGDVLRIGFAIYHDQADVARLVKLLKEVA